MYVHMLHSVKHQWGFVGVRQRGIRTYLSVNATITRAKVHSFRAQSSALLAPQLWLMSFYTLLLLLLLANVPAATAQIV